MHRPQMKLFEKVALPFKKIAEIVSLRKQKAVDDKEQEAIHQRIHSILWSGADPKWSFVRTVSESIKDKKAEKSIIRCIGEFRCRQTGELREFPFRQHIQATVLDKI